MTEAGAELATERPALHLSRSVVGATDADRALRDLLRAAYQRHGVVPARALTLIVPVAAERLGTVRERLRALGTNHPSRVVLLVAGGNGDVAQTVEVASDGAWDAPLVTLRELVQLRVRKRDRVASVAAPLVVSGVPTAVWPVGVDDEWVAALAGLCEAVLIDSAGHASLSHALERAWRLSLAAHVVDLEWLRSEPWRLRVAELFDPPRRRAELWRIEQVRVRHAPGSRASALLFAGWLASRLGWDLREGAGEGGASTAADGSAPTLDERRLADGCAARQQRERDARTRPLVGRDVRVITEEVGTLGVPGLAGVAVQSAGSEIALERGRGGLVCRLRSGGGERVSVAVGASRGERGILAEALREALLRDPTYRPALQAAVCLAEVAEVAGGPGSAGGSAEAGGQ
ncbi:MAG: glucose-6-phosphate dehydrogenase assembly protein OpcA [Thermoleophilum sp.]|nr:glucose-6-phosphate dehydrogenase assembly protein OpcA [Thermoleophilum sp.]